MLRASAILPALCSPSSVCALRSISSCFSKASTARVSQGASCATAPATCSANQRATIVVCAASAPTT